jgi:hypothetical protein
MVPEEALALKDHDYAVCYVIEHNDTEDNIIVAIPSGRFYLQIKFVIGNIDRSDGKQIVGVSGKGGDDNVYYFNYLKKNMKKQIDAINVFINE